MSDARRVLVLCDVAALPAELGRLLEALRREGAAVALRGPGDGTDDWLDAIAEADSVVCWK